MLHWQEYSAEEGAIIGIARVIVVLVVSGFFLVGRYMLFSRDKN
jgi:hypothetical protein